ncbi:MAG: hypothetical protein UX61_C0010G0005 [Parcubacteria group bacterium GW2011_GWA2_46_7]|nr:MAG: hypothetical protein UX14_C0015G0006 [Parcubacteria group bacterium GW2011_GWF1_45_5]KKU43827.1 MAG: hypothetical protein UX61_C0010G0005 [Parcubacteria group bacterium GW2011_GWA2_46_7]KKU47263.1 MAG: hypothetical protein UX66_C0019G0005 [Parcubacteria group bacterium GW2011_GWF2_46_8]OHD12177.1 MAG: hypothetical protein A2Z96_03450 [Spirochaetes bacterium GWB1_48_6]
MLTGIGVFIGEIMLQGHRLNGYLLLGTLLAFLITAIIGQKTWWPVIAACTIFMYFFYHYSFLISVGLIFMVVFFTFLLNRATLVIPYHIRYWIVLLAASLWHGAISIGLTAWHLVPSYTVTMGVLTVLTTAAIGIILIIPTAPKA